MSELAEQLATVSVPLTADDHSTANKFAAQQPTAEKAEQVYCNTLAVLSVQRYLQTLGITTEVDSGHSWHPLTRVLEDVADLVLPGLDGSLECRVVKAGDRTCHIPSEVHVDRLGYVVIQLDAPYNVAHLLGFVEAVSVTALPLSYLQPLTALIERFLDTSVMPVVAPTVLLRQWLNRLFEPDWEPPVDLLASMGATLSQTRLQTSGLVRQDNFLRYRLESLYRQQANGQMPLLPAEQSDEEALIHLMRTTQNDNIRWQCADLLWEINPEHPECPVMTAKDLGVYLTGHNLALAVGLLPKAENTLLILVRIYPFDSAEYLPAGLKLTGVDETGAAFFGIAARTQDNYIQFKFTADVGEQFALKVSLADAEFVETFVA